ncbi:hypothetical protein GWK47_042637 [Chionoecetes opilio]|uniref:Uncharacterized protein n=1 Tax=Chionoecetes opilio TaxID=41210 RepID=A0A8J4YMR7_CHIOP|nr:hypothetical protein GWK47_042637 [Chionoecetes opilio]
MAQSVALIDSVEEGLKRGVKRLQDDANTAPGNPGVYDTFGCEEGSGGDQGQEQDLHKTTECSPRALLRYLACVLPRKDRTQESRPLTERCRKSSPRCSSQLTRYLPGPIRYLAWGAVHQAKRTGVWFAGGLRDYASSGGYIFLNDAHSPLRQKTSWELVH